MELEQALAIAALVGIGLIVVGGILLGLFPNFDGFGTTALGASDAPTGLVDLLWRIVKIPVETLAEILKPGGTKLHIGQILITLGMVIFALCGILWLGSKAGMGSGTKSTTPSTPVTTSS